MWEMGGGKKNWDSRGNSSGLGSIGKLKQRGLTLFDCNKKVAIELSLS